MDTIAKIRDTAAAVAWRATAPAPLVFTNGVFDLLHGGHVAALEGARALGTALAVGINTDRSVRRLGKGAGRPVRGLDERCRLVAALEAVDCVIPFDEDTPAELIAALAPDVLVKGGDYRADELPGAATVRACGGRVVILPRVGDYSTTDLLERIRETC